MASQKKIALVTGGSRGLGKDMALRLAEKDFHVIITYHTKVDDAHEVVSSIKAKGSQGYALQLDVSQAASFDSFVSHVQSALKEEFQAEGFDALVNNAGTGLYAPFTDTTIQQFDNMVDVHLKAPYFLTQKLLPLIHGGGSIVNISSGLARFSFPGYSAYGTMKGAIETLTRYQAKELGERRIRVNVVGPGAIATDFGGGAIRDNKDLNALISNLTVLGRVGEADDIGGVVAFLCGDDAKWVNAQRIEVSGGIFV